MTKGGLSDGQEPVMRRWFTKGGLPDGQEPIEWSPAIIFGQMWITYKVLQWGLSKGRLQATILNQDKYA